MRPIPVAIVCLSLNLALTACGLPAKPGDNPDGQMALFDETVLQAASVDDTLLVHIVQTTGAATMGTQFDLKFDPAAIEVVSGQPGLAFQGAQTIMGVAPDLGPAAYTRANRTGTLSNVAVFFVPGGGGPVSAGEQHTFTLTIRAKASGNAALQLTNAVFIDERGAEVRPGSRPGWSVRVLAPNPSSPPPQAAGATPPSN